MYIHIFIINSSISEQLGCFQILATINNDAMNIGRHIYICSNYCFQFFQINIQKWNCWMIWFSSVQLFSHVWPCNPMDCSTPGLPVHPQLLEFAQTCVHWVGDAIQPSHPLLPPSPPTLNLSLHQGLFKGVSSLHQVAKVLVSASTSVLSMDTQDWSPLGWSVIYL